jgi:hypothetical protein
MDVYCGTCQNRVTVKVAYSASGDLQVAANFYPTADTPHLSTFGTGSFIWPATRHDTLPHFALMTVREPKIEAPV